MEASTQTSKKGSRDYERHTQDPFRRRLPKGAVCKGMEMKFKLQPRPQDVGALSNVGVSAKESCQPQSEATWAIPGKAVWLEPCRSDGRSSSRATLLWMLNMESQMLLFAL